MNKKFIVYKHVSPSKKIYIGITSQDPYKRWKKGEGYKTQPFYRAIKKYGWDNISHEILFTNLTEDEATQKESDLIKLYKSYSPKYGYNIKIYSEGKNTLPNEVKIKIGIANKKSGYTEGRKKALKRACEVIKNRPSSEHPNSKKIVCLNNEKIYPNMMTASKDLDISRQSVQAICKKEIRHANGYIFLLYDEYLKTSKEHINKLLESIKQPKKGTRNHKVICINTGEIFDTINDAIEKYNAKNVSAACRGVRKYAGTLNGEPLEWAYYEDYLKLLNENKIS